MKCAAHTVIQALLHPQQVLPVSSSPSHHQKCTAIDIGALWYLIFEVLLPFRHAPKVNTAGLVTSGIDEIRSV